MDGSKPYTIYFDYEIVEETMICQLRGIVTVISGDTYSIDDIQLADNISRPLLPRITLMRHNGSWLITASKKVTALSLAIGKAIDGYEVKI